MITGCKHKPKNDEGVYYYNINKTLTIRLCNNCHDILLVEMVKQFILETRCQVLTNDILQGQIDKLREDKK